MELKRTFEKGVMNKDLDERLVPNGYYTHAENIITDSTEGSDIGVVKNILSNKKITELNLGSNVRTLNGFSDETEQKIYYFVLSNTGSFLIEYDDRSKSATLLLHDTRLNKVLNLKDSHRILSIRKIYNDDPNKNLLLWTNNDMEVCCININRAKSYGTNGFEKEDIYLIKKPPVFSPDIIFTNSDIQSNEIEEKFIAFAYRYKYLDGEYSALSPFTNYSFIPKAFQVDFETLHNKAMENNYNAVNVFFETGNKRVTDIQLIAKFSNSDTLYIVETLNKEKEGLQHNDKTNLIYNNKKLYTVLPEKELYRTFDNVPRKAKALTLIGNRVVLGNYTEGYNIEEQNGNKIKLEYEIDVISNDVSEAKEYKGNIKELDFFSYGFVIDQSVKSVDYVGTPINKTIGGVGIPVNGNIGQVSGVQGTVNNSLIVYNQNKFDKGSRIDFNLSIKNNNETIVFAKLYSFIIQQPKSTLDFKNDQDFIDFIESINVDIKSNLIDVSIPPNQIILNYPSITIDSSFNKLSFILHPMTLDDPDQQMSFIREYIFTTDTFFKHYPIGVPSSLKSYMDYEVGIVYQDEYKRSSTVLTSINNTKFIPFDKASHQNKLQIAIKNKAPYWAKYYRFAIKSKPLQYETIYINRFYVEDGYTWAKLEADNKDKVKENDILLLKKDANGIPNKPIKVKVLEIAAKERDFIKDNKDDSGVDIIEEAGLYMKIKPVDFAMGLNNFEIKQDQKSQSTTGSGLFPYVFVDLFSTRENNTTTLYKIPTGSVITLFIKSYNKPDAGWQDNILNKTYYTTKDYDSLGEWFQQNILSLPSLYGNEGNAPDNYIGKIDIVRGELNNNNQFVPDPNGKEYLSVFGTKAGMTGGRYGYLDVSLSVRTSDGFYVFETLPKKEIDLDIFYLSSETFEIENGLHKGNISNQTVSKPAICMLDYFNCYTFGNGVESYKIRDGFNENYLNVDYTPTTTTIEEYKETTRQSDVIWSSVYNESSNINGLNEFNTALLNWKELDKQYGEIRLLHSREGNLLVIQEDKWGQVLYGKNAIYSAEGNPTITTTNDVLRDFIPYQGEYGITDIESFATVAQRCYAVDKKRGTVLRLSNDGLTEITNGMVHWFKTTLQERNKANVIAGIDPFYGTYNINCGPQINASFQVFDGQRLNKHNLTAALDYEVPMFKKAGDAELAYNVYAGEINIKVGTDLFFNNLSGTGSVLVPVTADATKLNVEITPVEESASFEITNLLPSGNPLKIYTIVLNDTSESGKIFGKAISVNNGINYRNNTVLTNDNVSEFITEEGYENSKKFPANGDLVSVVLFNDDITTKQIDFANGNKVLYLVTASDVENESILDLVNNATEVTFDQGHNNLIGSFIFNRSDNSENLVIIYDLRSAEPDSISSDLVLKQSLMEIPINEIAYTTEPIQSFLIKNEPENATVTISSDFNAIKVVYTGASPQDDLIGINYEIKSSDKFFDGVLNLKVNIDDE